MFMVNVFVPLLGIVSDVGAISSVGPAARATGVLTRKKSRNIMLIRNAEKNNLIFIISGLKCVPHPVRVHTIDTPAVVYICDKFVYVSQKAA